MTTIHEAPAGPLSHTDAMAMQATELERTLDLLRTLDDDDWHTGVPDCPAWDVRSMYLHVLGACEGAAFREMSHQMATAMRRRKREGGPLEANLSAVQIADRADLTTAQLIDRLTDAAPRTVRLRGRMPSVIRKGVSTKVDGPVVERWKLGYLIDTIYLRDLWMHRIDTCRALSRSPELSSEHDGRIVADVVAEWARRHGQPVELTLTGEAGGTYTIGQGGEPITMDAVEFCRVLSGRGRQDGLLATVVPF